MPRRADGPRGWSIARFAVAWAVVGLVVAVALIAALRGVRDRTLPPLRQTQLSVAAHRAGCHLMRATDRRPGNPPAAGAALGAPARPAVYDRAPAADALLSAVRHGVIVVHYRPPLDVDLTDELRALQALVPKGTIVTPNATHMAYRVAAVGWHRLLGCSRLTAATIDAIRLFRARNLGRGPDGPP